MLQQVVVIPVVQAWMNNYQEFQALQSYSWGSALIQHFKTSSIP